MFEKINNFIEREYKYMQMTDSKGEKACHMNNAFGALQFVVELASDEEFEDYMTLWNEWRAKFEKEIWG